MKAEDKKEVSNIYVSLKEHFDVLLREREKQFELHFKMLADAAIRQGVELERRLEGLNQLRSEYTKDRTEDRTQYVRQETYDLKVGGYDLFMQDATIKFTKLMTKYDSRLTVPVIISAIAVLIAFISLFYK